MATKKKKTSKKKITAAPKAKPLDDAALLKTLKKGPAHLATLKKQHADPKLSKRLTSLKKQGVVSVAKGRWIHNDLKVCPTCKGCGWVGG